MIFLSPGGIMGKTAKKSLSDERLLDKKGLVCLKVFLWGS
jgi:hypothetical protein